MVFLIPAIAGLAAAATTVTTGTLLAVGGVGLGATLVGKGLYDSGRKKGQQEGAATVAAEIQAQRTRLDELEAGL